MKCCRLAQGDMMIGRILTDGRMSARIKCAACAGGKPLHLVQLAIVFLLQPQADIASEFAAWQRLQGEGIIC